MDMSIERLEKHELFGLLSPNEMKRLSGATGVAKLKEGDRIYSEGVPASHLFVLIKGRVELRRPAKGGLNLLVDDLIAGGIFGVSSLMGTDRYLLNAQCVEDSEVLKIEGKALRQILDNNPTVGYAVQRRVSQIFFKRYLNAMERLQTVVQAIPMRPSPEGGKSN
jgi:signal-transduction protein with cAMP-binding, CBS, and nucleotidyltransferase domain